MNKFNYLKVPDQWNTYFSKYPQGYTILEALIEWVSQVDNMVDNQNLLNTNMEDFILKFENEAQARVTEILIEWKDSGFLDIVVSDALQTPIQNDMTVTVGENGDYTTINEALTMLSRKYPQYKKYGYQVNISLLSGFIMQEQILVSGIDLSWITITSIDNEVIADRASLTDLFGSENKFPLFGGMNGSTLPNIHVLFNMNETGVNTTSRDGVYLETNSFVTIVSGCGVKNASGYGVRAFDGCTILARGAIFTNAKERGCMISQGTKLHAPGIDLSGANGRNGFRAYRGCVANIDSANISNCAEVAVRISEGSQVDMQGANCSNAGLVNSEGSGQALRVFGASVVNAFGFNGSGAAGVGVEVSSGSTVDIGSADITNCIGASGCLAQHAGIIHASSSDASNNVVGYRATNGGQIIGTTLNANNCVKGFDLYWEGKISCRNSSAINCTDKAADVSTASELRATNCNFSGAGISGVRAYRGSDIYLYGTNCRKGLDNATDDIVCTTGSIIRANGAIGGVSKTANVLDNEGVIFN